ncbi:sulfatase-like hydrolase/transferase [Bacillaceae bacterium SIJ1]|uniref:sulfatase-like hydrolase/transferase n=1 Tax=Litoribacterium kuwaitense TaxID=1398745 RepID=UPI0013EB32DF|nr:sulfatase-like hydrolase/transferase [Litoribacterium kuwaitense]NGP45442.1 sulfatase-like hydrolase/transferase [Litoribacterium kuwaitense]
MEKPNIILVMTDQHRGDFMGCMGSTIVKTPHMDQMAEEGVLFTRSYCNSPLCVPSRMSMLTGRYPHETNVFDNNDHLASDMPTMAHALSLGGYDTVLCGRMHFVGPDQRHGYGKRFVGDITPSYPGGPMTEYGSLEGTAGQGLRSIQQAGAGTSPVIRYDEEVTTACEHFLEKNRESKKPFFLTVGYYGPHHPYVCPEPYFSEAMARIKDDDSTLIPTEHRPAHPWYDQWLKRLKANEMTEQQLLKARAAYAGLVSLMDVHLGRVLKAAKQTARETIILYTSDHGDMAGDHGMFWKRNLLEGAIHIPMIWTSIPGTTHQTTRIGQGRRVDVPVSLLDIAPTFTALGHAPPLPHVSGDDVSELIGEKEVDHKKWLNRPLFCELATLQDSANRAVICEYMKLITFYGHQDALLFDLKNDPNEKHDLSNDPRYADVKEALAALGKEGWQPRHIIAQMRNKQSSLAYMRAWGKQVGMGRMDLWTDEEFLETRGE